MRLSQAAASRPPPEGGGVPQRDETTTQDSQREHSRSVSFTLFSRFSAIVVSGVGAAVLVGWALDLTFLKSVVSGFATMKANTALALLGAGSALWLRVPQPPEKIHWVSRLLAVFVVIIGGLSLFEYFWPVNLHIDEFLFSEPQSLNNLYPGRMSPATASILVFDGLALLLIHLRLTASRLLSFLSLIGPRLPQQVMSSA